MTRLLTSAALVLLTCTFAGGDIHAMNKGELTESMSSGADISKALIAAPLGDAAGISLDAAKKALDAFISSTEGALKKGDKVALVGFGTFSVSHRTSRSGVNPATGKEIKVGKKLKDKDFEGQEPFVLAVELEAPGVVGIQIVVPPGSDPWIALDVEMPDDVVEDLGSGAKGVIRVNVDKIPMAPSDGDFPTAVFDISIPGAAIVGASADVDKSDMRGPFAVASGVLPGAWQAYLETGDHASLGDAVDLGDDAFDTIVDPNAKPDGCDGGTGGGKGDDSDTADPAAPAAPADPASKVSTAGVDDKVDGTKETASPLETRDATLAEITSAVAKGAELDEKTAAIVVDLLTNHGSFGVKKKKGKHKVTLVGFGTFSTSSRSARTGRNPQTGKEIKIPARKVVKFKPSKEFSAPVK